MMESEWCSVGRDGGHNILRPQPSEPSSEPSEPSDPPFWLPSDPPFWLPSDPPSLPRDPYCGPLLTFDEEDSGMELGVCRY